MSLVKKGDRFDYFGRTLEVLKVNRDRTFIMGEAVADAFGKIAWIGQRRYRYADLKTMGMRSLENE